MDQTTPISTRVTPAVRVKLERMAKANFRNLSEEINFLIMTHPDFKNFDPNHDQATSYEILETSHILRE